MPTTRPRHSITETESIAHALDVAARAWPELDNDRPALLRRLIELGAAQADSAVEHALAARLAAIRETGGALTGMYPPGERERLRAEWPE